MTQAVETIRLKGLSHGISILNVTIDIIKLSGETFALA